MTYFIPRPRPIDWIPANLAFFSTPRTVSDVLCALELPIENSGLRIQCAMDLDELVDRGVLVNVGTGPIRVALPEEASR